jgi:hypothetical protein
MADIVYDPGSGVSFGKLQRAKDMGDGSVALVTLGVDGFPPLVSLTGVSATGPGAALDNVGVRNNHSVVVTTSAGVSAGVVQLEGSQDGVGWVQLLGGSGQNAAITTNAANKTFLATANLTPFRFLRANITTIITGGTITAWVASAG